MTHPTNESEHTLSLSDLEVLEDVSDEVAEPNAHLRKDDSLLFAPATLTAATPGERAPVAAPGSGLLALPNLAATEAGGLGSLVLPRPLRPTPAPSRGLVAALVVASLAMVSAVALAAHSTLTALTPTAAPPAPPAPPRTIIAPLDPPPTLSMPRFEAPPSAVEPAAVEPAATAPATPAPTPVRTTTRVATAPTKKAAPKKVVAPTPTRACGDEIECLLADDSDTPFEPALETEPDPLRPESLDSFTISRTMKSATERAARCDDTYGSGIVKVRVTVDGDGTARAVTITSTPSQPLAACVADEIRATDFPESRTGATFNYVFPFR